MKALTIKPGPPAFVWAEFAPHSHLEEFCASVPGAFYRTSKRAWCFPADSVSRLKTEAERVEYRVFDTRKMGAGCGEVKVRPDIYSYHTEPVGRAVLNRRWMFNYEMGLGKTCGALETLRHLNFAECLVVCPSIVKQTWADEIRKWLGPAPVVQLVSTGKEADKAAADPAPTNRFLITSYELAPHFVNRSFGAVVLDESHYLKTAKAARSKAIYQILKRQPFNGIRLLLTGTPLANEPLDIHNQLDLLYLGCVGTKNEFAAAYCQKEETQHGPKYFGVNEARAKELAERLAHYSSRITKKEVAHILPPLRVEVVRVPPAKSVSLRELFDRFDRRDLHNSIKVDELIRASGAQKVQYSAELARETINGGETHVALMTHLKATAQELGQFDYGVPCEVITGDTPIPRRHKIIERLAKEPRAVLVGTMHSLTTGINSLIRFSDAIYAEMDYKVSDVAQSMARYHRIGSVRSRIRIVVLAGTLEEKIAASVEQKLRAQNLVQDAGVVGGGLLNALDDDISDEELFAACQKAAAGQKKRDVYV